MTSSNSNSIIISKLLIEEGDNFSTNIEGFLCDEFYELIENLKEKLNIHIKENVNKCIKNLYYEDNIDIKKYFQDIVFQDISILDYEGKLN